MIKWLGGKKATIKMNIKDNIFCNISIYNGKPDNSIDLTVTSPPYDNMRDYKGYNFNRRF